MNRIAFAVTLAAAASVTSAQTGLVVGVDDVTVPVFIDDVPGSGTYDPLFTGADIWGLTWDGSVLHAAEGSNYATFALDGSRTDIGTFSPDGGVSSQTIVGLAFDAVNGVLYGSDSAGSTTSTSPEGIYSIDPSNGATKLVLDFATSGDSTLYDFGGLAFNVDNGLLYGTSDDVDGSVGRGIYSIDPNTGTIAAVAAYPAGEADIDGLAYGDGSLYLVTDESGSFYEYDLGTGVYSSFASAFSSSEIFSGAAFIPIPEPTVAGLLGLGALAGLRRRRA
jgi:hypothetical protein